MKLSVILFFAVTGLISCDSKTKERKSDIKSFTDSLIVFYNVRDLPKNEITQILEHILKSNPKAIGLMPLFSNSTNSSEDSIFFKITRDNRVLFASYLDKVNGSFKIISSDSKLIKKDTLNEGVISYMVNEYNVIDYYIPICQDSERQSTSFPFILATRYDESLYDYFLKFRVNKREEILMQKDMDYFKFVDKSSLDEEMRGKIILLDDFEESIEEMQLYGIIDGRKVKTNEAIITANIILGLIQKQK